MGAFKAILQMDPTNSSLDTFLAHRPALQGACVAGRHDIVRTMSKAGAHMTRAVHAVAKSHDAGQCA